MSNTLRITIDITNYCNFNCIYCSLGIPYTHLLLPQKLTIHDVKIITMYVNRYLSNYNIDCCIRGGEPTLHNEFDKIIKELTHIKKLNNLILYTNGSISFTKYNINYCVFNELRISVHVDEVLNRQDYFNIILNNINWLLSNNIVPIIFIMRSIKTKSDKLNQILNTLSSIFIMNNIKPTTIKIVDANPTENYTNTKYDYSKVDSIYNQGYKEPVYYRRAINIIFDNCVTLFLIV